LQFIRFGEAIIADRYLYMASLGIFLPFAHYLYLLLSNNLKLFIAIAGSVTLLLSILSFNRNYSWQSDMNFYTALLQTFPTSSVAHSSLGTLYMQQGNLDLAEIHLNKATRLDPENYKAWHSKGALHSRQGRAMDALESLNRSIAIYNYPKAYFSRAMLHLSTGRSDLALSDIKQVLTTQPDNARAWYIQGACLSRSGKISEAIESYSRALSIDRSVPLYYIGRGKALIADAQFTRAAADLKIAIQQQPRNGECYYFLGLALQGNNTNPCAAWQKAISLGYKNAESAWANSCR
jgi:tetratricopeptide (TPR) repeat protein